MAFLSICSKMNSYSSNLSENGHFLVVRKQFTLNMAGNFQKQFCTFVLSK